MRRLNPGHHLGRLVCLIALVLIATIANSLASASWLTLQGGHYLIKGPNDGDSFHVTVEATNTSSGSTLLMRLKRVLNSVIGWRNKRNTLE